ncbi:hypothetical protein TNCT_425131 [Trichonephila clavata]|uniref:Uncharacterized protein n=1 Tax=Trichonephila clavata TaxID=2740835 RepID=A0A8X6G767_TRICU|nr:hypothetical protein TNCT_425131 [Trichonephila clavata]
MSAIGPAMPMKGCAAARTDIEKIRELGSGFDIFFSEKGCGAARPCEECSLSWFSLFEWQHSAHRAHHVHKFLEAEVILWLD